MLTAHQIETARETLHRLQNAEFEVRVSANVLRSAGLTGGMIDFRPIAIAIEEIKNQLRADTAARLASHSKQAEHA